MVSALVNALGMALAGTADLEEQVLTYLRDRQLLMVLDNVEHLIASAGPLVMAILQAAPALHLLITSRERLNWAEEWVVAVTGLPFPMAQTAPSQLDPITPHGPTIAVPESNFLTYSAIQLFLARAQQMGIQFEPDRDLKQRAAIARICALVQGIPLGIEMAAAWVHILSYSEIGNEIAQNLDFLTSSQHDLPIRQRSMRAVFEHSWHLLSSREQEVLAALSVFQGGFQREAAAGVVDASLPMLRSLCDKSLLQWNAGRYALHELLRQFAAEKLQLTPMNEQRAQERHARYYLALAEEVAAQLRGADAMPLLDQLDKEQDNLRCVLLWSLTKTEQMEIGLRLASALSSLLVSTWALARRVYLVDTRAGADKISQCDYRTGAGVAGPGRNALGPGRLPRGA
jgi:predicted ATPase